MGGLARRGVKRVVVLPLFLSRAERGYQRGEVLAVGPVDVGQPLSHASAAGAKG